MKLLLCLEEVKQAIVEYAAKHRGETVSVDSVEIVTCTSGSYEDSTTEMIGVSVQLANAKIQ